MQSFYRQLESRTPASLKQLIPEAWRVWLGYQVKVGWNRTPAALDFLRQPLVLPPGESEASLFDYLAAYHDENGPSHEMTMYLREAAHRFLYTLQLVPEGNGRLLEIGAGPYFMSLLLRRFTGYELTYTNYYGDAFARFDHQTMVSNSGERIRFDFHNINIEAEPLPLPDDSFAVVLLCEVLEHFTNDPVKALVHIKQVLAPGGHLILSTPNVNRLVNVARMLAGDNIYDPYSGYGPYGRHNREFNRAELTRLLAHVGFTVETSFTSDVHPNQSAHYANPQQLLPLLRHRRDDLGQYIFLRARSSGPAKPGLPNWLYRSYPPDQLSD